MRGLTVHNRYRAVPGGRIDLANGEDDLDTSSDISNSDSDLRGFLPKLVTSVLLAVVLAAVNSLLKGAWSPWLHTLAPWIFVAIFVYLVVATIRVIAPRLRARRRERRVEGQIRQHVTTLAEAFTESMSQSFVKSVGNILNPLNRAKVLDARAVNAYLCHLGTLCFVARNVAADVRAKRLAATIALARLADLQRDYARLCCEIVGAVATTQRRELHVAWDEIRDNTNSISERLSDLCRQVRELQGGDGPSPYFQNVPRSLPTQG